MQRREFLRFGLLTAGAVAVVACGGSGSSAPTATDPPLPSGARRSRYGPLREPNANGLMLPDGFEGRVVARAGEVVPGTGYEWHVFPDGGATFRTAGGWVYVSNSEAPAEGGVGALRFDADGRITDAYRILGGTRFNCAGGATPWGTWLSCEEYPDGLVWECQPTRAGQGVARPALGTFEHEAVAVADGRLYLTEDVDDGALYRFTPVRPGVLDDGVLEVAVVATLGQAGGVRWVEVPEPNAGPDDTPTRHQVPESTAFDGGEGVCAGRGDVYFTTKGDDRVWRLELTDSSLHVHYDAHEHENPVLSGVDNVTLTPNGDLYVAEDGGNMELVVLADAGVVEPVVRVVGHDGSEITGPAFDPGGRRLYFSSQRGEGGGVTYEVTGPFLGYEPGQLSER